MLCIKNVSGALWGAILACREIDASEALFMWCLTPVSTHPTYTLVVHIGSNWIWFTLYMCVCVCFFPHSLDVYTIKCRMPAIHIEKHHGTRDETERNKEIDLCQFYPKPVKYMNKTYNTLPLWVTFMQKACLALHIYLTDSADRRNVACTRTKPSIDCIQTSAYFVLLFGYVHGWDFPQRWINLNRYAFDILTSSEPYTCREHFFILCIIERFVCRPPLPCYHNIFQTF